MRHGSSQSSRSACSAQKSARATSSAESRRAGAVDGAEEAKDKFMKNSIDPGGSTTGTHVPKGITDTGWLLRLH